MHQQLSNLDTFTTMLICNAINGLRCNTSQLLDQLEDTVAFKVDELRDQMNDKFDSLTESIELIRTEIQQYSHQVNELIETVRHNERLRAEQLHDINKLSYHEYIVLVSLLVIPCVYALRVFHLYMSE